MKNLAKINGKFMASDDGTVAGLVFTDSDTVLKFLRMYNAEPEVSWFSTIPHYDADTGITYDVSVCYIMPTEYRHCINGRVNITGAFVIAFNSDVEDKTIYVLSDIVLAALAERNLITTGDCCNEAQG